ncbi:hypothetical protein AAC387_Pa11g0113 [Persea americana]
MQMQREMVLDFRTPQHPSMGTNNWGGASPMLARNIPTESLETRYLRLNTTRVRNEIFPAQMWTPLRSPLPKTFDRGPTQRGGLFSKLRWLYKKKKPEQGPTDHKPTNHKKTSGWLPGGDPRTRWPQGWC